MSSQTERIATPPPLTPVAKRWIAVGLATGPADRATAETAVEALYAATGLPAPRVAWCASPYALLSQARGLAPAAEPRIATALARQWLASPLFTWFPATSFARAARTRDLVMRRVWTGVGTVIEAAAVRDASATRIWRTLRPGLLGQCGAPLLAMHEALSRLDPAVLERSECARSIAALRTLATTAGWVLALDRVCLIAERPSHLHLDRRGQLHAEPGPAALFPDGFAVHARNGILAPAASPRPPAPLTIADIDAAPDHASRRALIERYGFARFLAETRATLVHSDATGRLWMRELPFAEPWAVVEVVNGTPEPDGSRRRYYLQVPPTCRTARQAVAWTYGLSTSEYVLTVRT